MGGILTIPSILSDRSGEETITITVEDEAEESVKEWAAMMKRSISEAELKCLVNYLKSNSKASVDDFDKVLFGWNLQGGREIENLADTVQGIVNSNLATREAFLESREELLSGLKDAKSEMISMIKIALERASRVPHQDVSDGSIHAEKRPVTQESSSQNGTLDDLLRICEEYRGLYCSRYVK